MSTPLRPVRTLPASPNLEQQKKQARELLDAARRREPAAMARFRDHHPHVQHRPDGDVDWAELALHDAQLVLAREYGFASWPKLKHHIDDVVGLRRTRAFVRELSWYEDRARGLQAVLGDGEPGALEQVRVWHPRFVEADDEAIRTAPFTLDDARLVYARQHGADSWEEFRDYLRRLNAGETREPFMEVLEAGHSGNWSEATSILSAHPELLLARGSNGNTLLNLAASLVACPPESKVESQASNADRANGEHSAGPDEARLAPLRLLLAGGADPNQPNDRGWTPLHQAAYRNDPPMVELLLNAGAKVDVEGHGTGGTPLAVALFWGHQEAAELLAAVRVVPRNLRVAAGLGRPDLVLECFATDGALTDAARAARRFYRPHSGFPAWQPTDDPQEVLDEALVWAAKADRVGVMPLLVDHGAQVTADPYRGTPLLWAAHNGRLGASRWLLDHGADVNQRATFGGPDHGNGVTALHLAAAGNHAPVAELLLARGADPTITDAIYQSPPAGWARHFGARDTLALLERMTGR